MEKRRERAFLQRLITYSEGPIEKVQLNFQVKKMKIYPATKTFIAVLLSRYCIDFYYANVLYYHFSAMVNESSSSSHLNLRSLRRRSSSFIS